MRQALHARSATFWGRTYATVWGLGAYVIGASIMISKGVPFVLIATFALLPFGVIVFAFKRCARVWLNGLSLEVGSRAVPLADVSRIELMGRRSKYMRVTYGVDKRVLYFIPSDYNFGDGEATLRQLNRLRLEARGGRE